MALRFEFTTQLFQSERAIMYPFHAMTGYSLPVFYFQTVPSAPLIFFPSVGSLPQTGAPNPKSEIGNLGFEEEMSKLKSNSCQNEQKDQTKAGPGLEEKNNSKPLAGSAIKNNKEEKKNEDKPIQKAKRPQTYLTERAYYMKQKLKGKAKNDSRILRNRHRHKKQTIDATLLRSSNKKPKVPEMHEKPKQCQAKCEQTQKRNLKRAMARAVAEYQSLNAVVPARITNLHELNEFCRQKMQKLLERMHYQS